jgi:hypothetical protein
MMRSFSVRIEEADPLDFSTVSSYIEAIPVEVRFCV